ncbi:uncharacterized protein MYCFIDRAFT_214390 [Pseudocercospora fijiensis CIRAD86]|uniref:Uncharacterized protein n=1 Tax=Pseudocercospora fijiensis (strain CIRAD86) TaxID=383855 RepID=M3BCE3_PSEFD|nr:uncharacterized protein MYCFIDRAFT_214390 [Pseudocercospora fijiensis CIRAD86]EME86828.1 hypothetical protein MYCFIDRAFT_214390 [Pseudocercospora fijiensis CIRAD86]
MASIPRNIDRSTLSFFAAAGLACSTKIATTAIITRLTATSLRRQSIFPVAAAASAFDILSIITLLVATAFFLRRSSRASTLSAWISGASICLVATILGLVALVSALNVTRDHVLGDNINQSRAHDLAGAGIAIELIALVPQSIFYYLIWPRTPKSQSEVPTVHVQERQSPYSMKPQSIAVHLGSLGPSSPKFFGVKQNQEPTSPSLSAFTSSPRSSLRHSASNALKPMTSRTRLLLGTSWCSTRDAREIHSTGEAATEAVRSTDEFENWDTSKVDDDFDNSFRSKTRLETIPGSRPVSPAHPLNGPFTGDGEELRKPVSPADTPVASPSSETGSLRNLPRSMSIPRRSSAPDNSADESHIHPLFRTESPAPPPLTSPGTIITASPYAGQIVSPEVALTSPRLLGQGSRPASPMLSPIIRSRPGSVKSFRGGLPTSPADQEPMPLSQLNIIAMRQAQSQSPISPND